MQRRHFLAVLAATLVASFAGSASAQTYPTHPIRLVVPFAPGGGTDILARLLAPKISEALGQQIVIDNRPGASSIIGTERAACTGAIVDDDLLTERFGEARTEHA